MQLEPACRRNHSTTNRVQHIQDLMQNRFMDSVHDRGKVHYCQPNHERYNQQPLTQAELSTVIKIRKDQPNTEAQFDNACHKLSHDAKIGTRKNNSLPC
jgi:hypothetical protein